jgi:short-subunit dehydrogenase
MEKIILITGASSGMGHETAKHLIGLGHTVYCSSRDLKGMQDLKKLGGHIIKLDVTKESDIKKAVAQIIKEQKKIDVLWNNAGFGLYGPVEEIPLDKARYQFEVNLFGLARMTQEVLPHMRKKKSGLIINTSSMGGKIYTPLGAWYHGTKHALEGWSDCLRLELKDFGINVAILEPGIINTDFGNVLLENMKKIHKHGPYDKLVNAVAKASSDAYKNETGSSPMVIAKTVEKIINAKKPKTRYLVGKYAKQLVGLRKWAGDNAFDKGVMKQFESNN